MTVLTVLAILRIPAAVLLLVAASGKAGALLRPRQTRRGKLAAGTVVAETICGTSMLAPQIDRLGSAAAAALGVAFLAYRHMRQRRTPGTGQNAGDCGCLGERLRPPPAAERALPWIVLAGGIAGAISSASAYASPLAASAGAALALALALGLAAASRISAVPEDKDVFRAVIDAPELAHLDESLRRSLQLRRTGAGTWVSTDFAHGDAIMNLTVRARTRPLGASVIDITANELLRLG